MQAKRCHRFAFHRMFPENFQPHMQSPGLRRALRAISPSLWGLADEHYTSDQLSFALGQGCSVYTWKSCSCWIPTDESPCLVSPQVRCCFCKTGSRHSQKWSTCFFSASPVTPSVTPLPVPSGVSVKKIHRRQVGRNKAEEIDHLHKSNYCVPQAFNFSF